MKKQTIWLLSILMALAFTGLLCIQILVKLYLMKEKKRIPVPFVPK